MNSIPTVDNSANPLNTILGLLLFAGIGFLIYRRRHKKKTPDRSASVSERTVKRKSSHSGGGKYTSETKLVSIAKFQKVAFNEYVVFDVETTGLDPVNDRIVEIGAVKVRNGKTVDKFQTLVNPCKHISEDASEVNHITDDMVKGAPTIDKVLPKFFSFAGSDMLAAHNAKFDATFLDNACRSCGLSEPAEYFDTMRLSVYWPGLESRSLQSFLDAAGIKNKGQHRALSDAESTAKLIILSMNKVK